MMTQQELDDYRARRAREKDDARNPPVAGIDPLMRVTAVYEAPKSVVEALSIYAMFDSRIGEMKLRDVIIEKAR